MSADDADDCAFLCFEEKGDCREGELWAGVAAAEVSSALLCEICSALHPMRAPPPFILSSSETREQIWKQNPEKYLQGKESTLG